MKYRFYAVVNGLGGRTTVLYTTWDKFQPLAQGVPGAKQRGFKTKAEAETWVKTHASLPVTQPRPAPTGDVSFVDDVFVVQPTLPAIKALHAMRQSVSFNDEAADALEMILDAVYEDASETHLGPPPLPQAHNAGDQSSRRKRAQRNARA